MRKRILIIGGCFVVLAAGILFTVASMRPAGMNVAAESAKERTIVNIEPWGPDQATYDQAIQYAKKSPVVLKTLRGTRNRMISFEAIDVEVKNDEPRVPPTKFRATFYDYTNNRAVIADGMFDRSVPLTVSESNLQIPPNTEEFDAALDILRKNPQFARDLSNKSLSVYPPMPPVLYPASENEKVQRTINVGLKEAGSSASGEIVGVNMITGKVVRYADGAPPTAIASPESCGIPSSGSSSGRGLAGSARITISLARGNAEQIDLWDFIVNRPSSSSGNDGSGIEMMDIKYKGKMMLKRLQIPVLNVKYVGSCGPYRDWQYAESQFVTPTGSVDMAPGVRWCPTPATTIVENRSDAGNYNGVAVYTQNGETVLVTEMNAGWYRYLNEYRFANDGTIRPRYGFGSVTSGCVCIQRNHHAYWRMDFDINGTNNQVVENPGIGQPISVDNEYTKLRNSGSTWTISNPATGDAVTVIPNEKDGTAAGDTFGQSDVWVLRYKPFPTELNDTSGNGSGINLAPYVNNEVTNNQDIVFWYGVHVVRSDDTSLSGDNILNGMFTPGPDIRPNW